MGDMRIKKYTNEEVHNNVDQIVRIQFNKENGVSYVYPVSVKKVTPKTVQIDEKYRSVVTISEMGYIASFAKEGYFLQRDVEEAVNIYKKNRKKKLESEMEKIQKELAMLQSLSIEYKQPKK